MYLKRIMWLVVIIVGLSFSQQRPGALFLLIPPTARATGMAYAFTAIADDASTNYYNAAGSAFLKSPTITATYCKWLPGLHENMHYMYLGTAYPSGKQAWGFDLIWHIAGIVDVIDFDGNYLGTYWAYNFMPKIDYSRRINDAISLGIAIKLTCSNYYEDPWILDNILDIVYTGTRTTWAVDLNALYKVFKNWSLGIVLHNIGPRIVYNEQHSEPLPFVSRFGIAYKLVDNEDFTFLLSAEITKVLVGMFADETNTFTENLNYELREAWKSIGTEISFSKLLCLRFGYFYDYEGQRIGITFGGGVRFKGLRFDIGIDEDVFDFPTRNRKFSLSYEF